MRRILTTGLLGGLLLAGCSSGTNNTPDAYVRPDVSMEIPDGPVSSGGIDSPPLGTGPEVGSTCDEDAMGEDYCIRNPGTSVGGGTKVTRQNPVPYLTCKP